jgi:hypothetical protein
MGSVPWLGGPAGASVTEQGRNEEPAERPAQGYSVSRPNRRKRNKRVWLGEPTGRPPGTLGRPRPTVEGAWSG